MNAVAGGALLISLCEPVIKGNEWKYVKKCIDTNWVSSSGEYVKLFENKFSDFVNTNAAVATINGTAAIHLALIVLGIGKDDEVILPSLTFAASVNPILYVQAKPIFVDVTRDTFVMDVNKIEELITERTKAILPVHLYGNPVDMESLMNIAAKYNLYVIEDATEALGAECRVSGDKWMKAGSIGDIGCFSFNGNKLITTGAGGMLVTNNQNAGDRARFLSIQAKEGMDNRGFIHRFIGYNYRMPNICAAMGVAQIEKISDYLNLKRDNAVYYNLTLDKTDGITIPIEKGWSKSSYWLYSLLVEDSYGMSRDALIQNMFDKGIETRPFFFPLHKMKPYRKYKKGNMNVTNDIYKKGVNLPSSVSLTKKEINTIVYLIKCSGRD